MLKTTLGTLALLAGLSLCPSASAAEGQGWYILRWMEKPASHEIAESVRSEDRARFSLIGGFDAKDGVDKARELIVQLREGDVIAYRMDKWEARKELLKGKLNLIGYRMYKYGHLAIVVNDENKDNLPRLFSSQSFKGANVDEALDTLATHSFDVYRIDQWDRVNAPRLHEFVRLSLEKSGAWYGYDFSGMFGLWNSNLSPDKPQNIGHDYICSTIVLTALYYAGLELSANRREGMLDLLTPAQVVDSEGWFIPLPEMSVQAVPSR
jgi:hypothetical protein